MWNRKELKARAKVAFKANYWKCVLVALILALLTGSAASSGLRSKQNDEYTAEEQQQIRALAESSDSDLGRLFFSLVNQGAKRASALQNSKITVAVGGLGLVGLALSILVFNPLIVGGQRFFLQNSRGDGDLKYLGAGFKDDWGNVVLVMFLKNLFLILWGLLFIIPGIIKAYSYRMVPYILKEHPELSGTQAITLSRKMMNGHKWDTFVLDLSFLGWILLSVLTVGILTVFYVGPYINATDAELYEAISRNYEAQPQVQ